MGLLEAEVKRSAASSRQAGSRHDDDKYATCGFALTGGENSCFDFAHAKIQCLEVGSARELSGRHEFGKHRKHFLAAGDPILVELNHDVRAFPCMNFL